MCKPKDHEILKSVVCFGRQQLERWKVSKISRIESEI